MPIYAITTPIWAITRPIYAITMGRSGRSRWAVFRIQALEIPVDEDIRRVQVAVDQAARMEIVERREDLEALPASIA